MLVEMLRYCVTLGLIFKCELKHLVASEVPSVKFYNFIQMGKKVRCNRELRFHLSGLR